MTKEDLRDIYFGFYDQLNEPERSEAKTNWDYSYTDDCVPKKLETAIMFGFEWEFTPQSHDYWSKIRERICHDIYTFKNKKKQPSIMTREKQEAHFEAFVQKQREVLLRKGNDYSANENRLSNFQLAGAICQLTPEQNCLSLIATKVARLGVLLQGKIPNNESIQDSILDLANYAVLLDMIISENSEKKFGEFVERDIPISREMQDSVNRDVDRFFNKLSSGCRN